MSERNGRPARPDAVYGGFSNTALDWLQKAQGQRDQLTRQNDLRAAQVHAQLYVGDKLAEATATLREALEQVRRAA